MTPLFPPFMRDAMRQATQLTRAGQLREATQAIQQALAGSMPAPDAATAATAAAAAAAKPSLDGLVLDGCVFESSDSDTATDPAKPNPVGDGSFTHGTHSHTGLTRDYKLFTPAGHGGKALPLVVMLHGCTQDPDDFSAGTAMNALAQQHGFVVLYPAQPHSANASRCWNWFKHNHQRRGAGEPALLADLVHKLMREHGVDAQRVFVAGLSAGGAMAAIVARAYPELFAGVGVHSGLPVGSANGVPEALAVMRTGSGRGARSTMQGPQPRTIVFHGDKDSTVHPLNGQQVLADALGQPGTVSTAGVETRGRSQQGQAYTRTAYADAAGKPVAEHWVLHGAGHAWSGGHTGGTYTDPRGVDASAEMVRFFGLMPD